MDDFEINTDQVAEKAKSTLSRIKTNFKKNQYEYMLIGMGAIAGYSFTKRRYTKQLLRDINAANAWLENEFAKVGGNFQVGDPADGGYVIPVLKPNKR